MTCSSNIDFDLSFLLSRADASCHCGWTLFSRVVSIHLLTSEIITVTAGGFFFKTLVMVEVQLMISVMLIWDFHLFILPQTHREGICPVVAPRTNAVLLTFNHCCNVCWEKNNEGGEKNWNPQAFLLPWKTTQVSAEPKPLNICPPRSAPTIFTACFSDQASGQNVHRPLKNSALKTTGN